MKKFIIICFCFCMSLGLVACDRKEDNTPAYDEVTVLEKAEDVITLVNEAKYEEALSNCAPELEILTPEKLKETFDSLGDKGAFIEVKDHEMVIQNNYAVMGLIVSYDQMDLQYTLSFDVDMKLSGFYIKKV